MQHEYHAVCDITISGSNTTETYTLDRRFGSGRFVFGTIVSCTFSVQAKFSEGGSFINWDCEDADSGIQYSAGATISASTGKIVSFDLAGVYALQITRVGGDGPVSMIASTAEFESKFASLGVTDQVRDGFSKSVTVVTSASPDYSVLDIIGGIIEFTAVNSVSGRPVEGVTLTAWDKTGLSPAFTLLLFSATPGGTTTDNGAWTPAAGNDALFVGAIKIVAGDWYIPLSGKGVATKGAAGQVLRVDATSLFGLIIADSTWNAASTSDLILTLSGYQK